jgi:hypothetical protein
MGVAVSGYSTAFFIPTILNDLGYLASDSQVHTIPVYVCCTGVMLVAAWASDRLHHRYSFTMGGIILATIGYGLLLGQGPPSKIGGLPLNVRYMAIFFVTSGVIYYNSLKFLQHLLMRTQVYITQPICIVWLANNMG